MPLSTRVIRLPRVLLSLALAAACSADPTPGSSVDGSADRGYIDETTHVDTSPLDASPLDVPATDTPTTDTATADTPPLDAPTADTEPADTSPLDTGPADTGPADTGPADTGPADTGPADTGPTDAASSNPAPRIRALSPSSATAGDMSFALTITGTGFLPGSTVTWAGMARTATVVNATTLRINVSAADVATAGSPAVVVTNPSPGGGSATASFAVYAPFATRTWLAGSTFRTAAGWFNNMARERVWLADIDADRIDDIVGMDDDGNVWVSRGTGMAFTASTMLPATTIFRTVADWFLTSSQPRVWLTDVTGDGRADFVGVDSGGGIWVSESTGTAFNASRSVASTSFATSVGYFSTSDREHVFLADLNADGKTDILGLHPTTGRIGVALATGTGSSAAFTSDATFLATSTLTTAADWFRTSVAPRLFLGDVTGDRRADLVGLATNGDLYVAESTGAAMNPLRRVGSTVFSDANGWFATPTQPRVSLADFNGDGKLDILGVGARAVGDGDIWTLESIGSGTTADAFQHVLLNESVFRTAGGWFAPTSRSSVWFADVTGDGRADALGVDATGGVWVARSIAESSSPGVTPARTHDFFLPAVKNGDSGLTAAAFFAPNAPRRVWVGDVTGDGARDLVAISSATGTDGDILWRMSAPAMVRSIRPVTRAMLTSGASQRIEVNLTRRIAAAAFNPSALELAVDDRPVVPSGVTTTARGAAFDVTFPAPRGADTRLDLALAARATDAWGHGLDGDGDGRPGGLSTRPARWSPALVAGASRVSIMPPDTTGIPRSSGFAYCVSRDLPGTVSASNPLEARVLVIAGGGTCGAGLTCAAGQSCVAGECQNPGGVDANHALVLVALDLIGVNPGRLAELLESRYGVPKQNLIVSATHAHAAFRSIHLFNAPYFDDRYSGVDPYETWLEDRVADGVGEALADMTPVEVATASTTSSLGMNRHSGLPLSPEARTVSVVELRMPGTPARTRALLVNFALHPVIMTGGRGINADFPGYLRQDLESARCAAGDPGCAVLYLQGGAGDINPTAGTATDDPSIAQAQGRELARLVSGLSLSFRSTNGAQVLVRRHITNLAGTSACNVCTSDQQHAEVPAVWSARTTAVAVGVPGESLFRFGTLPGEFFSGLQTALMAGLTPAPLFLGYANGYLGYFPDRTSASSGPGAYGVAVCTGRNESGPTFFSSAGSAPTNGDNMVAALRGALLNDLR